MLTFEINYEIHPNETGAYVLYKPANTQAALLSQHGIDFDGDINSTQAAALGYLPVAALAMWEEVNKHLPDVFVRPG